MNYPIEKIKIGRTPDNLVPFDKYFSEFSNTNNLGSFINHSRTGTGDLHLNEELYYPECTFKFFYLTPEQFSKLRQQTNVPYIYLYFFDKDINDHVTRCMKMQTVQISETVAWGGLYRGTTNYSCGFVSMFAYESYAEMISNKHETRTPV